MNRAIGIDYGSSKIGIALSDPLKIIAREYEVIWQKQIEDPIGRIEEIINTQKVDVIVLGMPYSLDGQKHGQAEVVEEFAKQLEKFNLPIRYIDERFSTKRAEEWMREQKKTEEEIKLYSDSVAARIILQEYLDFN